jgi:hypothetical protein
VKPNQRTSAKLKRTEAQWLELARTESPKYSSLTEFRHKFNLSRLPQPLRNNVIEEARITRSKFTQSEQSASWSTLRGN